MRWTFGKVLTTCVLLLLVASSLFAAIGDRDYLPSRAASALLPTDSVIGKIVDISSDPLLERTAEAFAQPWSADWVSSYVHPPVRSMFTQTWNKVMVDLLPISFLEGSVPVGDDSVKTVAVRLFPVQEGPSVAYSLVWQFSSDDDQWYLIAMSPME